VMYAVVQGRKFSVAYSVLVVLRRFLPILGVTICTTAAVVLGAFVLVFPGIILGCMYYVSMPACIAEQTGVFESMSRSSFLTAGHRWQVFGAALLYGIVVAIVSRVFGIVEDIVEDMAFPLGDQIGALIGTEAPMVFVNAFGGVLVSVLYYELRAAKEGKIASIFG
jgi:hypothetical protein